jgi:phosphoribosylformimino-5-aminoimidazole carboxamide ribotide isomerase
VDLYPAIDIRDGQAVRLRQGRFEDQTVYADDPLEAARAWVQAGARRLHVVDLDGAREGRPRALDHIERIAGQLGVPVQCGGGLRDLESIEAALAAGAARVVLGTAAHRDPDLLAAALERHGDRVAVAVDVRDGRVATEAWTQTGDLAAAAAVAEMVRRGVGTIVYTDADRDGMLEGADLQQVRAAALAAGETEFVYSGGIGGLDDLEALAGEPIAGVIVGKALYERRFTVAQAQASLGEAA